MESGLLKALFTPSRTHSTLFTMLRNASKNGEHYYSTIPFMSSEKQISLWSFTLETNNFITASQSVTPISSEIAWWSLLESMINGHGDMSLLCTANEEYRPMHFNFALLKIAWIIIVAALTFYLL